MRVANGPVIRGDAKDAMHEQVPSQAVGRGVGRSQKW